MFYKLIEEFSDIIVGYKVVEYKRYGSPDIYSYTKMIAKEKGIPDLSEHDLNKLIHEARGIH